MAGEMVIARSKSGVPGIIFNEADRRAIQNRRRNLVGFTATMLVAPSGSDQKRISDLMAQALGWRQINGAGSAVFKMDDRRIVGKIELRGVDLTGKRQASVAIIIPTGGCDNSSHGDFRSEYEIATALKSSGLLPKPYLFFTYHSDAPSGDAREGVPVLLREFIEGVSLSDVFASKSFSDDHIRAMGKLLGKLISTTESLLPPNNLLPEHVLFYQSGEGLAARLCNVFHVIKGGDAFDVLKYFLDAILMRFNITKPEQIKIFARGVKAGAIAGDGTAKEASRRFLSVIELLPNALLTAQEKLERLKAELGQIKEKIEAQKIENKKKCGQKMITSPSKITDMFNKTEEINKCTVYLRFLEELISLVGNNQTG